MINSPVGAGSVLLRVGGSGFVLHVGSERLQAVGSACISCWFFQVPRSAVLSGTMATLDSNVWSIYVPCRSWMLRQRVLGCDDVPPDVALLALLAEATHRSCFFVEDGMSCSLFSQTCFFHEARRAAEKGVLLSANTACIGVCTSAYWNRVRLEP